jgi:hypothetical protein
MDHIVILRNQDHEKIQLFRDKLAYRSPAEAWFFELPKDSMKHWEVVRELFIAKWVDKLDEEKMRKKMGDLTRGLDPLCSGRATLNVFSITNEECGAGDVRHMLKKLINSILDHLDDKQASPGIQDLSNDSFTRGFRAGYREAYKQWGEEVEERLDEAYDAGIKDGRKQCKGKQTTELCGEPTKTTTTVEAITQMAHDDETPHLLNDAGTSTEPLSTCETGIQANETPTSTSSPPIPATSPSTTAAQPPSTTPTMSTTTTTAPSPAPKQPPGPWKQCYTLPTRPTAPLPSPQPPLSCPEPRRSAATSQRPVTTKFVSSTLERQTALIRPPCTLRSGK